MSHSWSILYFITSSSRRRRKKVVRSCILVFSEIRNNNDQSQRQKSVAVYFSTNGIKLERHVSVERHMSVGVGSEFQSCGGTCDPVVDICIIEGYKLTGHKFDNFLSCCT